MFDTLEGKNILVTGGAGFIGSNLVDQLLKLRVSKITVLDNCQRGTTENLAPHLGNDPRLYLIDGDIRNPVDVQAALAQADIVFHLAVIRLTMAQEHPELCREVIVEGGRNLISAANESNRHPRIVFGSSATVYGEPDSCPIPESEPVKRGYTPYGTAKIDSEEDFARSALNWVGLRFFNVYGPKSDIRTKHMEVVPRWVTAAISDKPINIEGSASRSLDLTYVDDVVNACLLAAISSYSQEIYNVGTGKSTTLGNLAELIVDISGRKPPIKVIPSPREFNVTHRLADISRAKYKLGYKPLVNLREGLTRFMSWATLNHSTQPGFNS